VAKGTIGERVAKLEEGQDRTDKWQATQNGTLVRLEGKVDSLRDHIDEKIDSLRKEERGQSNQWVTWAIVLLIGLPGTAYAAVNLLKAVNP
jgi:ribosome-interacting GTPase 1